MTATITPGTPATTRRRLAILLPLLFLLQLVLVGLAVGPQLSARVAGDELRLRVEPVDPIDPFRGAYVTLGYPDLRRNDSESAEGGNGSMEDGESGAVYVSLKQEGDVWVADEWSRERPSDGRYLRCDDRDWQIRCGIESYFLPQDEAAAVEQDVRDGELVAVVKVDGRGNAAITGLEPAKPE
jgi:uncharacterized membrane-anchored protein